MKIASVSYLQYEEIFISAQCQNSAGLAAFYAEAQSYAQEQGLLYINSHVFSDLSQAAAIKEAFYTERTSVIFGRYGSFVNACIFFVRLKTGVFCATSFTAHSACLQFADRKLVFLDGLRYTDSHFEGETHQMYAAVSQALSTYGMNFLQVERSWNFIHDILDVYPQFNRARDTFFASVGLADNFPAGT